MSNKLKILNKQDISHALIKRVVYRIIMGTNNIPSEDEIKDAATELWKIENEEDEVTVFVYLPGMDLKGIAYAVLEFSPSGMDSFKTQEYALIDRFEDHSQYDK